MIASMFFFECSLWAPYGRYNTSKRDRRWTWGSHTEYGYQFSVQQKRKEWNNKEWPRLRCLQHTHTHTHKALNITETLMAIATLCVEWQDSSYDHTVWYRIFYVFNVVLEIDQQMCVNAVRCNLIKYWAKAHTEQPTEKDVTKCGGTGHCRE